MKNLGSRNEWILKSLMGLSYDENLYELEDHEQVKLFEHMVEIDRLFKRKIPKHYFSIALDQVVIQNISINEEEYYTDLNGESISLTDTMVDDLFEVRHKWVHFPESDRFLSIWESTEHDDHYVGLNFVQGDKCERFVKPDKWFTQFVFNNIDHTEFMNLDKDINKCADHWLKLMISSIEEVASMVNIWL